jgi:SSS family solute:Na+ symporter
MTLLTFLFFTALVGVLTWILTRKDDHGTSTGYFLAGRTLTGGFIAGSLLLTNLSTEQLVGLNGLAFKDGICVMAWEVIAGASLVIMALYFLPKYLRSGIATIPEFLEKRFDGKTRSITSFIFILAYAVILLPIILYSGATGLKDILDLKTLTGIQDDTTMLWITVWFIGIVGSIYAIFGGLRSVAVSDTLNGFGLLVGSVLIVIFALNAVGDGGLLESLASIKAAHPEKFNSLGTKDSSVPFSTLFTGVLLLNLFYWTTNQQIIQRTFGATSLAEGQRGVLIAGIFKVLAPLVLVLPGVIAFHLFGSQEGFKPDHAYGTLVSQVLPKWLTGFFAAVMVGAILSSFNSALNSTATLFSLGVYQHLFKHGVVDEKKVIKNGKIVGTIVAIFAMVVAPMLAQTEALFGYLQKMNALYFIPIFAVVLAGFLFKRAGALAANISLVAGCVILIFGYFVPPFSGWLEKSKIHDFHFIGIVFAILMIFQFVMSKVNPLPRDWEHLHSGEVDLTPWKWAKPLGIGIVAFVVILYLSLADFSVLKG